MTIEYFVTGATGHLGRAVVLALLERGDAVRALVLPGDPLAATMPAQVQIVFGDVREIESLRAALACAGAQTTVVHCAAIVSIGATATPLMRAVNVDGTRNVLALCREYGVGKLVYVSSVHALPVLPAGVTMAEIDEFHVEAVHGGYAQTKAAATAAVLAAARAGLNASVVHPSGLLGPGDYGRGHMTQLVLQVAGRRLPANVGGGFDFVDVRDVAAGIVACCDKGARGACYILGGEWVQTRALTAQIAAAAHVAPPRLTLPLWLAKAAAPLAEAVARANKAVPIYTRYSLYTLSSNALFSSARARRELGYRARPLAETIADTVAWLRAQGRLPAAGGPPSGTPA